MKKQSFPKQERIVSQKLIDELFTSGQSHSLTAFPLRAVFLSGAAQLQLLLSVPKRRFKHAVDRNRVKRQLREAFRKNKQLLADALPDGQAVALAFIWMSVPRLKKADAPRAMVARMEPQ